MGESNKFCVILTTCPNPEEANRIATLLIKKHIAACVQVTGITSYYEWKGKINTDSEQLLLIKARSDFYNIIENLIRENHSYEIPEIIQVPIEKGYERYLNWINETSS